MRGIARAFVLSTLAGLLLISTDSFAQHAAGRGTKAPETTGNADAVVPVETLDNPQQIASLNVVDTSGAPLGSVVSVKTGSDGKANPVMVAMTRGDGAGRAAAILSGRL